MAKNSIVSRIKNIQNRLDLEPDGIIGADTLTAIENRLFEKEKAEVVEQDYSLTISRNGLDQLIGHEIVSPGYYNRNLKSPIWPGGSSGVTIGIGYDLGYNRVTTVDKDWHGRISDADLDKLKKVSGKKAQLAKAQVKRLKSVSIDFDSAKHVFSESTLPRYAQLTKKAFPGVEVLYPDAQAALLSLVYNRGGSLSGSRRKEMAKIKVLVSQQDYPGIAQQIIEMKRLWEGKGLAGLLRRRDEEASLVANAEHNADDTRLIRV